MKSRVRSKRSAKGAGPSHGRVRVGTASWADPGFVADWYPAGLASGERLAWYATHFDLVEVNATFYAVPAPKVVARWAGQTPDDFVFDVKLHQFLSRHSTPPERLPAGLRGKARVHGRRVELTPQMEEAVTEIFLEGIQPLYDADKLGALLLQLSPGFRPRENDLAELDHLLGLLATHPVAVELRNRDWLAGEARDATVAYFEKRGVTLVSVDTPRSEHFTVMPGTDAVTNPALAYLRAHGRNAEGYVRGRSVAERFDHEYSDAELHEIADRVAGLSTGARETHVIFNNNKSNYAPKAAARFRQIEEATLFS